MGLITLEKSYTGTYRGSIIDHGVSLTTGGFPQVSMVLHAKEYYNEEEKAWVSWTDREDTDITAYLVLAGKEQKEIFHCRNIEKAVGWDGASWKSLAELDLSEVEVQFRIEENVYNDNTTLQVARIDHYDAEPGRSVRKLDAAELKALDGQFAPFFRKRKGESKPVKPVGRPVIPGKKPTVAPEGPPDENPETIDSDGPPAAPPKKSGKTQKPKNKKGITQGDAWAACKKAKDKSVSSSKLSEIWLQTVETLAPNGDEAQMTPELWLRVRDIVVEQVSGAEVAHL